MRTIKRKQTFRIIFTCCLSAILLVTFTCVADESNLKSNTKVVMLGTGTPILDYKRAGPGVAVVVGGEAYLFDTGGGVVRNAIVAAQTLGINELDPTRIKHVFFTHIHSDHTIDLPVLVQSMWFNKQFCLNIYGPQELKTIDRGLETMVHPDVEFRMHSIQPVVRKDPVLTAVHIIKEGVVFKNEAISIEAFLVSHGEFKSAFGYKVTTADKVIVISGDTTYNEKVAAMASGADILVHEAMSATGLKRLPESWQKYHHAYHTTTDEVAEVANKAQPKILVLYHVLFFGVDEQAILQEVKTHYDGKVVVANDLDIF